VEGALSGQYLSPFSSRSGVVVEGVAFLDGEGILGCVVEEVVLVFLEDLVEGASSMKPLSLYVEAGRESAEHSRLKLYAPFLPPCLKPPYLGHTTRVILGCDDIGKPVSVSAFRGVDSGMRTVNLWEAQRSAHRGLLFVVH